MVGKIDFIKKIQLDTTVVQSILIDKIMFTKTQAIDWITNHKRKNTGINITDKYYRFRQINPDKFIRTSFKTIQITTGVKAIIGRLKNPAKSQHPDNFVHQINELANDVDVFCKNQNMVIELQNKLILQHAKAHMYKDKKLHDKVLKKMKELGYKHTF